MVLPGILPNPTVEKGENAQCRQKRNAKEQRLHLLICFCPRLGLRAASHQMNIAIGEVGGNLLDDGGIASDKGFLHVQHNRIRNVAVCKKGAIWNNKLVVDSIFIHIIIEFIRKTPKQRADAKTAMVNDGVGNPIDRLFAGPCAQ